MSPNRLKKEKSPYLLQHADNPVDWFPWGPEAFETARRENKPILLSIGYSTCHWCHVMERESYEDPAVAALMNQYLVNIKVDREERPDVDQIYMTAVSAMTGQGGWPLNVFLTPDVKPIFGGTYFPPKAKWGQPAWADVVSQIGQAWQESETREKMLASAAQITEALQKYTTMEQAAAEGDVAWLDRGFDALKASYDSTCGGFAEAPRFPMPVYHNFLLRYYARHRHSGAQGSEALTMSLETLRAMARGGIYDHLGGGFARYSTDKMWRVPHFEKMLYDNAQLAVNYAEAYQITRDEELKRVALETLAYVQRRLTHPEGGFFSAEDADSLPSAGAKEKKEGAFYVWTKPEILEILGQDEAEELCAYYGVESGGNAAYDPHGEFVGKNILYIKDPAKSSGKFAQARRKLFEARQKRPPPHLDDKIISAWNGLMISAFAKAYPVFGDAGYLLSAQRAAVFLKEKVYDLPSRQLYRRWREGERQERGVADDYAFLCQGLIDLYEADFNPDWLDWAVDLAESEIQRFYDAKEGGFFMTASDQDEHLLLRIKEDMDNVEPCASSTSVLNLLRLAQYTDRKDFQEMAEKTLACFGRRMQETPRGLPQMLVALDFSLTEPLQIVIAGTPGAADTESLLQTLRRHFIPIKTVILADGGPMQKRLAEKLSFLTSMHPLGNQAAAYVCVRHTCQRPTSDPLVFGKLLGEL